MYACNIFDVRDMRGWERKPDADKTWVHLQSYSGELYTNVKKYEHATGSRHGFESAANVRERPPPLPDSPDKLKQQLGDIALMATAGKEHIQQMSNCTDNLLAVIKEQQTQLTELMCQNGMLIVRMGTTSQADSGAAAKAVTAKVAAANAGANQNAGGKATGSRGLERDATYTEAEKIAARALVEAINAGSKTASMCGPCMLCKKHWGTEDCKHVRTLHAMQEALGHSKVF